MGVVYKARHRRLNRLVALKMILAGTAADPRVVQRFMIEAEVLARIHTQEFTLTGEFEQVIGSPARLPVPEAPRWTIDSPRPVEIPPPLDEVAHAELNTEPTAEPACAAGVAP